MSQLLLKTSTKKDGNLDYRWGERDEVLGRRTTFLERFGKTSVDCVVMEVEHGDKITHVDSTNRGETIKTEAFITKDKDIVLFLLTADCFPVAFYDSTKEVLGLAHLGRKPTEKKLATKMIAEMQKVYDSSPHDIRIFIGPGIHRESYVFDDEVIQKEFQEWTEFLTKLPTGESQVDLLGNIKKQLLGSGVLEENITINPADTVTSEDYFSHYRSVRTGEPEGRFVTIAALI